MSETDTSTAAVEAHAKRLRGFGHSGTHGILPVTLALLADRDRLQRENDNLRQIERNVQAVREHEHQRANAAEAEVSRLKAAMRQQRMRVRRIAAATVSRIRREDYPDELGNTPPDTFAWGVRMAADIIIGGRDTKAAQKLREDEADRDRLAAEVARLMDALEFGVGLIRGDAVGSEWKQGCAEFIKRAHAARREGEA